MAALFAGIGVLAPVPVEGFLRWRRARQTSAHLSPLWSGLTQRYPKWCCRCPVTRSPVSRAELVSTRQRIEIADALHRVRISHERAAAIRSLQRPVQRARADSARPGRVGGRRLRRRHRR